MVFVIVAAILAYRRAKDAGRNGLLWALATAGVFIGTQLLVSLAAGFLMGIGVLIFGWDESIFDELIYVGPVTVVAIAASIFTTWLLFKYIDRPADSELKSDLPPPPPPPPPTFGQGL